MEFLLTAHRDLALVPDSGAAIKLHHSKYLNELIEQDHRTIERTERHMLGFKDVDWARRLTARTEAMHIFKKGQLEAPEGQALCAAGKFYSLAI